MSVPVPARPSGTPPFPNPHPLQLCARAAHARACECAVLRATAWRQRAKPSTTDSALSSGTPPHDSLPFPPLSTLATSGQHTGHRAKAMEFRSRSKREEEGATPCFPQKSFKKRMKKGDAILASALKEWNLMSGRGRGGGGRGGYGGGGQGRSGGGRGGAGGGGGAPGEPACLVG